MSEPAGEIYVVVRKSGVTRETGPAAEAAVGDWVKGVFGVARLDAQKIQDRLADYGGLLNAIAKRLAATAEGYSMEEITLHLAVDVEVGVALVGDVGVEAAIDLVFKRSARLTAP